MGPFYMSRNPRCRSPIDAAWEYLTSPLSHPHGGLAFLSACQTAMGDENLSDEAIHIAAGMLFAGYSRVVGTMWSISDKLAPLVAKDVYGQLFRISTRPDYREAARSYWAPPR